MPRSDLTLAFGAITLSAAIFGFFYAWTVSTMWGLDAADPRTAIAAMQSMNASVRNAAFAPAFFGTGPALLVAALAARRACPSAAQWFAAAGLTYILAAMLLTLLVNVPMNEALASSPAPQDRDQAQAIWQAYSARWQMWNQIRTLASGAALLMALAGLVRLARAPYSV